MAESVEHTIKIFCTDSAEYGEKQAKLQAYEAPVGSSLDILTEDATNKILEYKVTTGE